MPAGQSGEVHRTSAQSATTQASVPGVASCAVLNVLNGFSILAMTLAVPRVATQWNLDRTALSLTVLTELVCLCIGSIVIGQVFNRFGRRSSAGGCLAAMALGSLWSAQAGSVGMLTASRVLVGLGVGGMLVVTAASTVDYANGRYRNAAVSIMAAGYPLGGLACGLISAALPGAGGWRDLFLISALANLLGMVLVAAFLKEPVVGTVSRRHADSRDSSTAIRSSTIFLTASYFLHILTFYFALKNLPVIVTAAGLPAASVPSIMLSFNLGGLAGCLCFSLLTLRLSLRPLLIGFLSGSTIMVALFAANSGASSTFAAKAVAAGFFANAGLVGLYALIAASFPSEIRATRLGLVTGIGRTGMAAGPAIGTVLLQTGMGLTRAGLLVACGSLIAAACIMGLPRQAPASR